MLENNEQCSRKTPSQLQYTPRPQHRARLDALNPMAARNLVHGHGHGHTLTPHGRPFAGLGKSDLHNDCMQILGHGTDLDGRQSCPMRPTERTRSDLIIAV